MKTQLYSAFKEAVGKDVRTIKEFDLDLVDVRGQLTRYVRVEGYSKRLVRKLLAGLGCKVSRIDGVNRDGARKGSK
jgi:hypothetical protein